jgi:hypothetical protein
LWTCTGSSENPALWPPASRYFVSFDEILRRFSYPAAPAAALPLRRSAASTAA